LHQKISGYWLAFCSGRSEILENILEAIELWLEVKPKEGRGKTVETLERAV
jgi:predicted RNase H-like HicB family nuclease